MSHLHNVEQPHPGPETSPDTGVAGIAHALNMQQPQAGQMVQQQWQYGYQPQQGHPWPGGPHSLLVKQQQQLLGQQLIVPAGQHGQWQHLGCPQQPVQMQQGPSLYQLHVDGMPAALQQHYQQHQPSNQQQVLPQWPVFAQQQQLLPQQTIPAQLQQQPLPVASVTQHNGDPVPPDSQLGCEQQRAVDAVHAGRCIFLTGGAGVGKSFTVEAIVAQLWQHGRKVDVTASTGTAAVNVGGKTIHSWAGIKDVDKHPVEIAEGLWKWQKYRSHWKGADVLVLDEVSMIDCDMLEKVDYLARYMRGWRISNHPLFEDMTVHELHPLPFGGLQLIAVGDFFQLPPVSKDKAWDARPKKGFDAVTPKAAKSRSRGRQGHQSKHGSRSGRGRSPMSHASTTPNRAAAAVAASPGVAAASAGTPQPQQQQQQDGIVVKQQVPVVMVLLPPEAVDVHAAAKAAVAAQRAAANTAAAAASGYAQHQHQQQAGSTQTWPNSPAGGPGVAAGGFAAGTAPSVASLTPLSARDLLRRKPKVAPTQPSAAAIAAQAAAAPAAAANQQPAGASASYQQQQQGMHQVLSEMQAEVASLAGKRQALLHLSRTPPEVKRQRLLAERPDVSQPFATKTKAHDLGLQLLLQGLDSRCCARAGLRAPAAAATAAGGAPAVAAAGASAAAAAAAGAPSSTSPVDGSAHGAAEADGAASPAGQQPPARAAPPAGADDFGDDIDWEEANTAIKQAEQQLYSSHPQQHETQRSPKPLQQQGQQLELSSQLQSPLRQQQQEPASMGAEGGQSSRPSQSRVRSALESLELLSQPPLPFADFSVQPGAQPQAGPDSSQAGPQAQPDAGPDSSHVEVQAARSRPGAAAAPGGSGGSAARIAQPACPCIAQADVEAAAALPLPIESPGTGATALAAAAAGSGAAPAQTPAAAAAGGSHGAESKAAAGVGGRSRATKSAAGSRAAKAPTFWDIIEILGSDSEPDLKPEPEPDSPIVISESEPDSPLPDATGAAPASMPAAEESPVAAGGNKRSRKQPFKPASSPAAASAEAAACLVAAQAAETAAAVKTRAASAAKAPGTVPAAGEPCSHAAAVASWAPLAVTVSPLACAAAAVDGDDGGSLTRPSAAPLHTCMISPVAAPGQVPLLHGADDGKSSSSGWQWRLQLAAQREQKLQPPASPEAAADSSEQEVDSSEKEDDSSSSSADEGAARRKPRAWMREDRPPEPSLVCGHSFRYGISLSKMFDVKEVKLGHVYGENNGRRVTAWQAGALKDERLPTRPGGFNWNSRNPDGGAAVAGTSEGTADASGSGGGSSSGVPRLPVQFNQPLPGRGLYCFKSPAWAAAKLKPVILKEHFRQSDPELLQALGEVRIGHLSTATQLLIAEVSRALPDDGIVATHIFPTNAQADKVNAEAYAALGGPELECPALDRCCPDVYDRAKVHHRLEQQTTAKPLLKLKPGTQVLLTWNLDVLGGLVNGTRGVVKEFVSIRTYLEQEGVKFANERQGCTGCGGSDNCHHHHHHQQQQQQQQQWQQVPTDDQRWQSSTGCCGHHADQHHQQQQQQALPTGMQGQQQQQHQQQQQQPQQQPQPQQLPRWSDQRQPLCMANKDPEPGVCSCRHCPCRDGAWSKLPSRTRLIKLPDAEEPVSIELRMQPWQRDQVQQTIIWLNHCNVTHLPRVRFSVKVKTPSGLNQAAAASAAAAAAGDGCESGDAGPPGMQYRFLVIGPQAFSHTAHTRRHPRVILTRMQLPLLHAWAITVHKSQGMSISKLVVNVGGAFGAGMVYVALSRCVSKDGLQINGKVPPPICDRDVIKFYEYLDRLEASDV